MLKYKLSGVWFVLAVVHIHLELIGLQRDDRDERERHYNESNLKETDESVLLKHIYLPKSQNSDPHLQEAAHTSPVL